jgi:hypothetical protein
MKGMTQTEALDKMDGMLEQVRSVLIKVEDQYGDRLFEVRVHGSPTLGRAIRNLLLDTCHRTLEHLIPALDRAQPALETSKLKLGSMNRSAFAGDFQPDHPSAYIENGPDEKPVPDDVVEQALELVRQLESQLDQAREKDLNSTRVKNFCLPMFPIRLGEFLANEVYSLFDYAGGIEMLLIELDQFDYSAGKEPKPEI